MSVDCFYEGENMLVINPDECIDCGVVARCPAEAIIPDSDDDGKWSKVNEEYSAKWPNIKGKEHLLKMPKNLKG